ncbi:hypothetical protein CMI47_12830 [Candidatus Pacearchaeota archaeon]|nr:hypothetical protein [Candidatus Pacearchaeota archaeon]|tara:strand:+ start:48728 stop:49951 length:1224 start_codon:yes stop_codon:yes gene_type:complete
MQNSLHKFIEKSLILENRNLDLKNKLQIIIDKVLTGDEHWLEEKSISVKKKDSYFVLNYNQFGNRNDFNKITRGLVIDTQGNIVSFPFIRFFNLGEKEAEPIDLASSDIIEKLDGTLVGLAFLRDQNNKPIWHTRKMLSSSDTDLNVIINLFTGGKISLLKEISKYIKKLTLSRDVYNYTLIFEAILSERPVITQYTREELGLYLIGARDLETLTELGEAQLDRLAKKISAKRPRIFDVETDYDNIIKMMDSFQDDFEGFVVRQRGTDKRIKIKKETYLKRHRLIGQLQYKNLVPLWLEGEREEIEAYFEESKEMFSKIEDSVNKLVIQVQNAFDNIKHISNRKEYAAIVLSNYKNISSFLFKLFGKDIENLYNFIIDLLKKTKIDNTLKLLNLHDKKISEDSTENL